MIPTYNSQLTIEQTLESISNQTVQPRAVYVVDDYSNDETIMRAFRFKSDLDLRIIKLNSNSGPWGARNAGVKASDADFISFVDSDDVLLSEHISMHHELFMQGFDAVASNYFDWIPESDKKRLDPREFPTKKNKEKLILKQNFVAGFSSIKREVFERIGGFRPEVTEDWDLWIRFFRSNYSMAKSSGPTYLYRWSAGSLSRTQDAHSRDLRTLKIARIESASRNLKTSIDIKVISMMSLAFISRDRYFLESETEILSSFPRLIRTFHASLDHIDHLLLLSFKKIIVRKQQQMRNTHFEKSRVDFVDC